MGSRAKAGLSFEIPVQPPNLIRHDEEMGGCPGVRSIQNNSNNVFDRSAGSEFRKVPKVEVSCRTRTDHNEPRRRVIRTRACSRPT